MCTILVMDTSFGPTSCSLLATCQTLVRVVDDLHMDHHVRIGAVHVRDEAVKNLDDPIGVVHAALDHEIRDRPDNGQVELVLRIDRHDHAGDRMLEFGLPRTGDGDRVPDLLCRHIGRQSLDETDEDVPVLGVESSAHDPSDFTMRDLETVGCSADAYRVGCHLHASLLVFFEQRVRQTDRGIPKKRSYVKKKNHIRQRWG